MNYTIIKNSESHTGYDIPDCTFEGLKNYANGWQFECEKDGKIGYSSVAFGYGMPDAKDFETTIDLCRWNGWEPTGRVIFRGYYEEYYDCDERDWYYEEVTACEEV